MPGVVMVTCETCKRVTVVNPRDLNRPECSWCELFRLREENKRLLETIEGLEPGKEVMQRSEPRRLEDKSSPNTSDYKAKGADA